MNSTEMVENKASLNNEARQYFNGKWGIMGKSNGSIVYAAQNEEDAKSTLAQWDASQEMFEALEEVIVFLGHIQPRVGEQAFEHIWTTVTEAHQKAMPCQTPSNS